MSTTIVKFRENPSDASKQKRSPGDNKKELQEVIDLVRSAKNKLGNMTLYMGVAIFDTGLLDDALEALDDAIDIMEDTLDDIK